MTHPAPYVPWTEREGGSASFADLHERLGESVARLPVDALPRDRPTFGCSFRDIPPVPYVDMSAVDRLQDIAADAREEMGLERWNQLQAEWADTEKSDG